jgi:hypothetical protein
MGIIALIAQKRTFVSQSELRTPFALEAGPTALARQIVY